MSNDNVLYTQRLYLRLLEIDDAVHFANLVQSTHIPENGFGITFPYTVENAQQMIVRSQNMFENGHYRWAIVQKDTEKIIGLMSLSVNQAHHNAEIGYWIGDAYWNQGFATEAAYCVLQFAFEQKGLHRVFGQTFSHNPASERVLEKLGMKYEGELREHLWHDFSREYKSLLHYGCLKHEFDENKDQS